MKWGQKLKDYLVGLVFTEHKVYRQLRAELEEATTTLLQSMQLTDIQELVFSSTRSFYPMATPELQRLQASVAQTTVVIAAASALIAEQAVTAVSPAEITAIADAVDKDNATLQAAIDATKPVPVAQ